MVFEPIPHTPRHRQTSTNGSTTATEIIYLVVTSLTDVNTNDGIVEMDVIVVALLVVACMAIATIDIIAVVVVFTAASGTVDI